MRKMDSMEKIMDLSLMRCEGENQKSDSSEIMPNYNFMPSNENHFDINKINDTGDKNKSSPLQSQKTEMMTSQRKIDSVAQKESSPRTSCQLSSNYSLGKKAMDLSVHMRGNEYKTIFDDAEYFARNYLYKLMPITFEPVDETIIHMEHNYCREVSSTDSNTDNSPTTTILYSDIEEKNYKKRKSKALPEEDIVCSSDVRKENEEPVVHERFIKENEYSGFIPFSDAAIEEHSVSIQPLDLSLPLLQDQKTGNMLTENQANISKMKADIRNDMELQNFNMGESNKENVTSESKKIEVTISRPGQKEYYEPCEMFLNDVARISPDLIKNDCYEIDIIDRTCSQDMESKKCRTYYIVSEPTWRIFKNSTERIILTNDLNIGQPIQNTEKFSKPTYIIFDQYSLTESLAEICKKKGGSFEYTCLEESKELISKLQDSRKEVQIMDCDNIESANEVDVNAINIERENFSTASESCALNYNKCEKDTEGKTLLSIENGANGAKVGETKTLPGENENSQNETQVQTMERKLKEVDNSETPEVNVCSLEDATIAHCSEIKEERPGAVKEISIKGTDTDHSEKEISETVQISTVNDSDSGDLENKPNLEVTNVPINNTQTILDSGFNNCATSIKTENEVNDDPAVDSGKLEEKLHETSVDQFESIRKDNSIAAAVEVQPSKNRRCRRGRPVANKLPAKIQKAVTPLRNDIKKEKDKNRTQTRGRKRGIPEKVPKEKQIARRKKETSLKTIRSNKNKVRQPIVSRRVPVAKEVPVRRDRSANASVMKSRDKKKENFREKPNKKEPVTEVVKRKRNRDKRGRVEPLLMQTRSGKIIQCPKPLFNRVNVPDTKDSKRKVEITDTRWKPRNKRRKTKETPPVPEVSRSPVLNESVREKRTRTRTQMLDYEFVTPLPKKSRTETENSRVKKPALVPEKSKVIAVKGKRGDSSRLRNTKTSSTKNAHPKKAEIEKRRRHRK